MERELQEIPLNLISNEFGDINKDVLRNFEKEGWSIISIRNQQVTLQRKLEKGRELKLNKIEYKEVKFKDLSDETNQLSLSILNEMGQEGWELTFVSGGKVIFKRVLEVEEQNVIPVIENRILTELEEKQAYIYKKILSSPEIKSISMKYQNGDKISLEISSPFEKMNLISNILQYNSRELGISIVPLYSNVKDYNEFEHVLFIELLKPVNNFSRGSYDDSVKALMKDVVSLEIQF